MESEALLGEVSRRRVLQLLGLGAVAAAGSGLVAGCGSGGSKGGAAAAGPGTAASTASAPANQKLKSATLRVGTLASSNFQQAFSYYDQKTGFINQVGKKHGYDISVKWYEFPTAPTELAAFVSKNLDIGPMATFPLVSQLSQGKGFQVLTNTEGLFQFLLMVRKGGSIHTAEDLRGKTVGLAVGSTHEEVFRNFIKAELGQTLDQAHIKLVNQPVPVPTMPKGLDAYQTFIPAILPALEDPKSDIEPLYSLAAPPQTGEAYSGPLGKGAGIALPSAKKSPWYPEGFVALRNVFCSTTAFVDQNADLVRIFIEAHETAMRKFESMSLTAVTDLYPASTWKTTPRDAYEKLALGRDLVYSARKGWVWPTAALPEIMYGESVQMTQLGILKQPLSKAQIQQAFAKSSSLLQTAYTDTGSYPDRATFTDASAEDKRGVPIWEFDWNGWTLDESKY